MNAFADYAERLKTTIDGFDWNEIAPLAELIREAWSNGKQVFMCGNGGSAGNAIHLANDYLYGVAKNGGKAIRVTALPANSAVLTCLANDISYDDIYSQQLETLGNSGDVLVVLSGSGNSPNVVKALEKAKELAAKAAEAYKQLYFGTLEKALGEIIGPQLSEEASKEVHDRLAKIVNSKLVNENDINRLGYQYLRGNKNLAALALLKANSQLFPESPNVYDSYAEALVAIGNHQLAIVNLKIAVDLAKKTQHPDLEYFQRNLTALTNN